MKKFKAFTTTKKGIGVDGTVHERLMAEIMKNKKSREAYYREGLMYNFVEAVKKAMAKKRMSYYALAKSADLDHQVLARLLKGQKNAELATLSKVASGIGAKLRIELDFGSGKHR